MKQLWFLAIQMLSPHVRLEKTYISSSETHLLKKGEPLKITLQKGGLKGFIPVPLLSLLVDNNQEEILSQNPPQN